ncbi:MAG: flagellar biosynthetic protein FliO [Acetobacteraceae bacterium]
MGTGKQTEVSPAVGGWAGWLWSRVRNVRRPRARLELLERIALAPRQTLALVEADGRRFLVATSAEGSPAFLALGGAAQAAAAARPQPKRRVSW